MATWMVPEYLCHAIEVKATDGDVIPVLTAVLLVSSTPGVSRFWPVLVGLSDSGWLS